MVRTQHIDVEVHTGAKVTAVYALLRDGASWPAWTSIESFQHVSFTPTVPGTGRLWRWGIGRFVRQCAKGLAAYAQTTALA